MHTRDLSNSTPMGRHQTPTPPVTHISNIRSTPNHHARNAIDKIPVPVPAVYPAFPPPAPLHTQVLKGPSNLCTHHWNIAKKRSKSQRLFRRLLRLLRLLLWPTKNISRASSTPVEVRHRRVPTEHAAPPPACISCSSPPTSYHLRTT